MFPNSHFEADGKFPSLNPQYSRKTGHTIDPFWEEQRERWYPLLDNKVNLREQIIEMNVYANENCKNYRRYDLPRLGIIGVVGDSLFDYDGELEQLREAIAQALPQVWVGPRYPAGQSMYGFTINLAGVPVGAEKEAMKDLALVINYTQEKQKC